MKKFLCVILSVILFTQSIPFANANGYWKDVRADITDTSFFSIPRFSQNAIQKQCSFRINKKICEQYSKYGKLRPKAWDDYDYSYWNAEHSEYYNLSAAELYDKYEQVAKDINYLWSINPEYKDMKLGQWITNVIIAWDITVIAVLAGTVISPLLAKAGFPMASRMASLLPESSAAAGTVGRRSLKVVLKTVLQKMAKGRFWADLGITFGLMVADGIFVESAFFMFTQTSATLQMYLQEHADIDFAIKSRDLLQEITNVNLTEEQKEEMKKSGQEIYNLKQDLRDALKKALAEQDWKEDTPEHRLIHREAVVTLYALEYVRAQMADISDSHRYRESAIDIAQIYFAGELTNLSERKELFDIMAEAYKISLEQTKKKVEEDLIRRNGGLALNSVDESEYIPFHAGNI